MQSKPNKKIVEIVHNIYTSEFDLNFKISAITKIRNNLHGYDAEQNSCNKYLQNLAMRKYAKQ